MYILIINCLPSRMSQGMSINFLKAANTHLFYVASKSKCLKNFYMCDPEMYSSNMHYVTIGRAR